MKMVRLVALFVAALVCMLAGNAIAYDISGTVSFSNFSGYSAGKSSRVFISANTNIGPLGTSIDALTPGGSAPFTIRGVPSGTVDLHAFMDKSGTGLQHASDPSGAFNALNVSSNTTGITIGLNAPPAFAPVVPGGITVSPGPGGAVVQWQTPTDANGLEFAESYNIYWSTDPSVSPTHTTGSFKGYPAAGDAHFLLAGLANGSTLYFVVTAQIGTQESGPSPSSGPIVINAPSGGSAISGTVTYSGTQTGRLWVVAGGDTGPMYFTSIANPTFPQAYSIPGVPDGSYQVYTILDTNNDGVIGLGDVKADDKLAPKVSVAGTALSGIDTLLVPGNVRTTIATYHFRSGASDSYSLNFHVQPGAQLPVRVTLNGGPGITGPIDLGINNGWAEYQAWMSVPSRPGVGDSYSFAIDYSNGSNESVSVPVTGVVDTFATPVYPANSTGSVTPVFSWSAPSPLPSGVYSYSVWVNGGGIWSSNNIPSTQTTAVFNFDNNVHQPLTSGGTYYWNIAVQDSLGNQAISSPVSFFPVVPTSVNGLVSYTGSKSGRIYLSLQPSGGGDASLGTSVAGAGSTFTINGVPAGAYTLNAFMDTVGNGMQHASDPSGSVQVTVDTSGSVTVQNFFLTDPSATTPQTPSNLGVSPGSGVAFIRWDTSGLADSYSIYWSTNSSFTPVTATGSKLDIPADKQNFYVQTGLTNGTVLYYMITAKSGANVSASSAIVGPITIGAPSGGSTVSGTVAFSNFTPTGPLYLVVENGTGAPLVSKIGSPASPQSSFTVTGVPNGTFFVHAFVDMNNNGILDIGDFINGTNHNVPSVTVNNASVSGLAITLSNTNATASVQTAHLKSNGTESYSLTFGVDGVAKQPVSVSLVAGPAGITYPVDLANNAQNNGFSFTATTGRPSLSDIYTFQVTYAGGSSEPLQASVTGIVDNFPVPVSPIGSTTGLNNLVPTFFWSPPSSMPTGGYYSLWLNGNNGGNSWNVDTLPNGQTSALYNFNHTAGQSALTANTTYNWQISVKDSFGNSAAGQSSFTTSSTNPQISSFSPTSARVGSLVTISGANFDPNNNLTGNTVSFNGTQATVTGVASNKLYVVVPSGATTGTISLTNSGGTTVSSQTFTVDTTPSFTTLSRGAVWHRVQGDLTEYDVLDVGINSYVNTLAGMTLTVKGPNFNYTFADTDINPGINGQLAFFKSYPKASSPLVPGIYTFTLTDSQGHVSHRVANFATVAVPPTVSTSTIQYQRKSDGTYRFSWAPVNDSSRTYYYRVRIALNNSASSPIFTSDWAMTAYFDNGNSTSNKLPAGAMVDGNTYKVRVETCDAPTVDLTNVRADSNFKTFTPQASDYNPGRLQTNFAAVYNRTDGTDAAVVDAVLNVSDPASVTSLVLTGPGTFSPFTFQPSDFNMRTSDGTTTIKDFYHKFTTVPPTGLYTFTYVANGITHTAYATLTAPVSYPVVDTSTMQAEEQADGTIRFSWANVNHVGALYYRVVVSNAANSLSYMSNRQNMAFVDVSKALLTSMSAAQWRVEVYDSSDATTQRNRFNTLYIVPTVIAYDAARPVINSYRVRNMTKSSGANFSQIGVNVPSSKNTLAQIVVTDPSGIGHDLLTQGRYSSDFTSYLLETAGSPAPGLYTIDVTDSAGKSSRRYFTQTAAHSVPPVDYHNFYLDLEPNGVRVSWAPVASDVPIWYQGRIYYTTDLNGDGLIDFAYSPSVAATSGTGTSNIIQQASVLIPTADLSTLPDPNMFLIRAFDGSDSSVISNSSQSVMVAGGSATVGTNFSLLTDADQDGYASSVDKDDSDPSVYPFNFSATTQPTVSSTTPVAGSTGVLTNTSLTVVFSKVIDQRTLPGNFTVSNGVSSVAGSISYRPAMLTATFVPSAPLAVGTNYTASVSSGVKDEEGHALTAPTAWSFTTSGQSDGVCGSSNQGSFSAPPTTNLCSSGTPSTVIASGPAFFWTCNGVNGGNTASCFANQTPTAISGRVTDSSLAPLSGVFVEVLDGTTGNFVGSASTDSTGNYTALVSAGGTYKVQFSASGYVTQWYNGATSSNNAQTVSVANGTTTPNVNATLARQGIIRGQVRDSSGPVSGVYVNAFDSNHSFMGNAFTDASGNYELLLNVAAGSFKVEFFTSGYVTQWYNGTSSFASANMVPVNSGIPATGINATLVKQGSIQGTVTDLTSSNPLTGVSVTAYDINGGSTSFGYTDANGNYTVTVPGANGSYKVQFSSNGYATKWYSGATVPSAAQVVPVTNGQATTSINIALAPSGAISGRVTDLTTNAVSGMAVTVYDISGTRLVGSGITDASGNYTVSVGAASGSFKIQFGGVNPGAVQYLPQWYHGSSSQATAQTVTVNNSEFKTGIDAVMTTSADLPAAPTGLQAVGAPGSVQLSWNPSDGANSYNVFLTGVNPTVTATGTVLKDAVTAGLYEVSSNNSYSSGASVYKASIVTLGADGTSLSQSKKFWNGIGGAWTDTAPPVLDSSSGSSDMAYLLTANGWQLSDTSGVNNLSAQFFGDGSAVLTNSVDGSKQKMTVAIADLSGVPVAASGADALPIDTSAPAFPAGSLRYDMKFSQVTDQYQGGTNGIYSGIPDLTTVPTSGYHYFLNYGSTSEIYMTFGTGNTVNIYQDQFMTSTGPVLLGTGTWSYQTVLGQDLLLVTIPPELHTASNIGKDPFFAVINGVVTMGGYALAGQPSYEHSDSTYNKTASDFLMANFDADLAVGGGSQSPGVSSTGPSAKGALIGTTSSTAFVPAASSATTAYSYAVSAKNTIGESSLSIPASAAPLAVVLPVTTASILGGTYNGSLSVTLTSSDAGAVIYYTTDGSTPVYPVDGSTKVYSAPIAISATSVLKYFSRNIDGSEAVNTQTYVISSLPITSASPAGGSFTGTQSVTLSTSVSGAVIYYTTDGSTPAYPVSGSTQIYSTPISIPATTLLKFFARTTTGGIEAVKSQAYFINQPQVPSVSATPAGGLYNAPQMVTLSPSVQGSAIYYTLDGSDPSAQSTLYINPITVSASSTLKYFAIASGVNSTIRSQTYSIDAAKPVTSASPGSGTFSKAVLVTLKSSKAGTIYFTTDGSFPTADTSVNPSTRVYFGPVAMTASGVLNYFAVDTAGNREDVKSQSYVIDPTALVTTATPAGGLYNSDLSITLSSPGVKIFYTTDGSTPTAPATGSTKLYTGPINLVTSATLNYFAQDGGGNNEPVKSQSYTFDRVAPAIISASPTDAAVGVPLDSVIRIEFSKAISVATLPSSNQVLRLSATTNLSADGKVWTMIPSAPLAYDTAYSYTLSGIKDPAGNALPAATYSFKTVAKPVQATVATLSLALSANAVILSKPVTVSGVLSSSAVSSYGQAVSVAVTKPDGSIATLSSTTDGNGSFSLEVGSTLTQPGNYKLQAFAGSVDGSLAPVSSAVNNLKVLPVAGYAIIVVGSVPSQEGAASYTKTATRVKNALTARGIDDTNILSINAQIGEDQSDVAEAITQWASDRLNKQAAPLQVILIDHGDKDQFYVGDYDAAHTITPEELAGWMGTLESQLNPAALAQPRFIVIGSCFSGTYIPALAGQGRIIITSTSPNEQSFRGPLEADGIRSGEYFIDQLYLYLKQGQSTRDAFNTASADTAAYTRRGGIVAASGDKPLQNPLASINGDQVGVSFIQPGLADDAPDALYLGAGDNLLFDPTGMIPKERSAKVQAMFLTDAQTSSILTLAGKAGMKAWFEVRAPSIQSQNVENDATSLQKMINLTPINMAFDTATGTYTGSYDNFTEAGSYDITFYLQAANDPNGDITSSHLTLYKNRVNNRAPNALNLIAPAQGSTTKNALLFNWFETTDPDNDMVTYTLQVSRNADMSSASLVKEGLVTPYYLATYDDGLMDLAGYYWQVTAIDSYGSSIPSPIWQFATDNTNGGISFITGTVKDSVSGASVVGAKISANGSDAYSVSDGSFALGLQPGSVSLTASAKGYLSTQIGGLTAVNMKAINQAIVLRPDAPTVVSRSISTTILPVGSGYLDCPATVVDGKQAICTVQAAAGYIISDVSSNFGGSLVSSSFTTNNVSGDLTVSATFGKVVELPVGDTVKPVVTAFDAATSAGSSVVTVNAFTATDDTAVTGYLITESSTVPSPINNWTATAPSTYTVQGTGGTITLYAWAKDFANNVSAALTKQVVFDTAKPTISAFDVPAFYTTGTVSGLRIAGSDNVGITGYLITDNPTIPALNGNWSGTTPTSFNLASASVGQTVTLYAWARDAAGNISNALSKTIPFSDIVKPAMSSFTGPATFTTGTITDLALAATDNVAVTGYLITQSATPPSATVGAWSGTAPTSYTVVGNSNQNVTLYAWAKDAAGNVSDSLNKLITYVDTVKPVVSSFTAPATFTTGSITGLSLAATDNVAVAGYLITQSATPPLASDLGWGAAPTSYTIVGNSNQNVTLYAWAKDAAGNVSTALSRNITYLDGVKPVMSSFTGPATFTTGTITGLSLAATDNVAVTGYLITESSTAPSATVGAWSGTAPTSYTIVGNSNQNVTLYAWAKDAAGNVSDSLNKLISYVDTVKPTVSAFSTPTSSISRNLTGLSITASDNVAVTGYLITESSTAPSASGGNWSSTAPTSYSVVGNAATVTLYAWAKDTAGNVSTGFTKTVTINSAAPALNMSTLADHTTTKNVTLNVAGTVNAGDAGLKSLTVNGTAATVAGDGSFSVAVTLVDGANTITTVATNNFNVTSTDTRTITLDRVAPGVTVASPADNSATAKSVLVVSGTVDDPTALVSVKVNNGSASSALMDGTNFSLTLNLASGLNTIEITATDLVGNTSSVKRSITYDASAPTLAISSPAQDLKTTLGSITISGTVTDTLTATTVSVKVDTQSYTPTVAADGSFSQSIDLTADKSYAVFVTATDQAGNKTTVLRNINKSSTLVLGDITGDGKVDISDALKVLRMAVGLDSATADDYARADVGPLKGGKPSPDGVIDISDALVILEYSVGLVNW
jgi:hypothetical protein